jgi:hypothetical protein
MTAAVTITKNIAKTITWNITVGTGLRARHQTQWRQQTRIGQYRKCGPLLINHAFAHSPRHWS